MNAVRHPCAMCVLFLCIAVNTLVHSRLQHTVTQHGGGLYPRLG